jgi:hypothetical protein
MIYRKMKANQTRYRPIRNRVMGSILVIVTGLTMAAQAQDDKSISSGAHVGMTIEQSQKYYHRIHIGSMGHSGAPNGEVEVEFRTG